MLGLNKIKRLSEIGKVLVRHGFLAYLPKQLISLVGIEVSDYDKNNVKNIRLERELRLAFEELGTTFIKLGQLLSLRSDVIPESMANEFKKLTDDVKPIDFSLIRPIIESELSAKIEDIFSEFDENHLAAASISQVYAATLKENGKEVVVKVRKPGIVETIKSDMEIILWIADALKMAPYAKNIDFKGIAEEFFWSMNNELNLVVEKSNNQKFITNFQDEKWNWLSFPKMYDQYCAEKVLVMDKIVGLKLDELVENEDGELFNRKIIADEGARMLMQMVLVDGFFHADLHQGNIFFKENNGLAIIDCGLCASLDKYLRESISDIFIAFVAKDWEKVANIYLEISNSGSLPDKGLFVKDVKRIFQSLPDNLSEIDASEIMQKISAVIFKYKLKIPRELTLLLKTFSMVEGLCRKLDPQFELISVAGKLAKEIFVQKLTPDKIANDVFGMALKTLDIFQTLPATLINVADKIEKGSIQRRFLILFEGPERDFISKMVTRVCSAFMMAASLITYGFLSEKSPSCPVYIFFFVSAAIFLFTFKKRSKKK